MWLNRCSHCCSIAIGLVKIGAWERVSLPEFFKHDKEQTQLTVFFHYQARYVEFPATPCTELVVGRVLQDSGSVVSPSRFNRVKSSIMEVVDEIRFSSRCLILLSLHCCH